eukprot:1226915-Amphidinium_carterae.1
MLSGKSESSRFAQPSVEADGGADSENNSELGCSCTRRVGATQSLVANSSVLGDATGGAGAPEDSRSRLSQGNYEQASRTTLGTRTAVGRSGCSREIGPDSEFAGVTQGSDHQVRGSDSAARAIAQHSLGVLAEEGVQAETAEERRLPHRTDGKFSVLLLVMQTILPNHGSQAKQGTAPVCSSIVRRWCGD